MEKSICLLSLAQTKTAFINHAQQRVLELVSPLFPAADGFSLYLSEKSILPGLEEAFKTSDIVLLGIDSTRFLSFKRLLIGALRLTEDIDEDILHRIAQSDEAVSDSLAESHALVPRGAVIFRSEDGFFSGFATASGSQHLLLIPLDPIRIDSIIENGFFGYLSALANGKNPTTEPLPEAQGPAVETMRIFTQNNLRAAIVDNRQAAFVRSELRMVLGAQRVFEFVACDEEKGERTQKDYLAFLARTAKEKTSGDVGAAVSHVFAAEKDGGRLFVFVAVADGTRARVAKVFAQPDETPHMLLKAATATMFDILADYAQTGGFRNYPGAPDDDLPAEEKKKNGKLALGVLLSIAAALLICGILIVFSGKIAMAFRGEPTTADSTTDGTATPVDTTISTDWFDPGETGEETTLSEEELLALLQKPSYADESNPSTQPATTAKPTTRPSSTAKPTTARPGTTTKPVSSATSSSAPTQPPTTTLLTTSTSTSVTTTTAQTPQPAGNFVFSVKGFGHGVGMSQEGAKVYATQGRSYEYILLHYYHHSGISIVKNDPALPEKVRYAGNDVELIEFLVRSTAQEIGTSSPTEALKAQAVAIYTYVKKNGFAVNSGQLAYNSTMTINQNSNIYKAVTAVLGEYVSYDNGPALTVFFARSAGRTVSSASVWGGTVAYLAGGRESPEAHGPTSRDFNTQAIKGFVAAYNTGRPASSQITLGTNPAEWLEILRKDGAGYVERIRVGNREMNGNAFRAFTNYGIRSHCFTFTYTPA